MLHIYKIGGLRVVMRYMEWRTRCFKWTPLGVIALVILHQRWMATEAPRLMLLRSTLCSCTRPTFDPSIYLQISFSSNPGIRNRSRGTWMRIWQDQTCDHLRLEYSASCRRRWTHPRSEFHTRIWSRLRLNWLPPTNLAMEPTWILGFPMGHLIPHLALHPFLIHPNTVVWGLWFSVVWLPPVFNLVGPCSFPYWLLIFRFCFLFLLCRLSLQFGCNLFFLWSLVMWCA